MTDRAYIIITRPSSVTQNATTGVFSGGDVTTVLSGYGDYQPMDETKTIELDGTRIEGVNAKLFYGVPSEVASLQVDDDITVTDEYLNVHVGTVAGFRAFDGTILARMTA